MTEERRIVLRVGESLHRLVARFGWGAVAVLVSCFPLTGALSTTRVYSLRDLSFYFWPAHLWLRSSLKNGEFPLWDPYVACGQAALSDPVRHMLYPPVALMRFVPSAELGFNLAVALPFPLAAAGMYLFLSRRVGKQAATIGAIIFAASGPMLSTANILNFSWAAATIPWVFYVLELLMERPTRKRFAALTGLFGMFLLAGEGPTLVGSAALCVAYTVARAGTGSRCKALIRVVGAGLLGIALSGALSIPFLLATLGSPRASGIDPRVPEFWSLHPLTLLQTVSYGILGDPTGEFGQRGWIPDLNGAPDPFVYSVYLGVGVLALAGIGFAARRYAWEAWFWGLASIGCVLLAFGRFNPANGVLRAIIPMFDALRFPAKLIVCAAFAIAVLSALGWEHLAGERAAAGEASATRPLRVVAWVCAGFAGALVVALTCVRMEASGSALAALSTYVGTADPRAAADFLEASLRESLPRLIVLLAALAVALTVAARVSSFRSYALATVMIIAIADPVANGFGLFPMSEVRNLREPAWVADVRDADGRVYVAGRLQFGVDRAPDPDDTNFVAGLPIVANSALESVSAVSSYTATFPSAWRLRDSVSFDNAMLWPREYWIARDHFRAGSREQRLQYLRRAGVRYFLVPWQEAPSSQRLRADAPYRPLALWMSDVDAPRVFVTAEWIVESDTNTALSRLGEERREVLISSSAPASGLPGAPAADSAVITDESSSAMTIEASSSSSDAVVVLRDSFAAGWAATIDGIPAEILRADGLYRAIRIPMGLHRLELRYEPPGYRLGIGLTSLTALGLASFAGMGRRSER